MRILKPAKYTIRAKNYFVLVGRHACYRCKRDAKVYSIGVLPGFSYCGSVNRRTFMEGALLMHIEDAPEGIVQRVARLSGDHFHLEQSESAEMNYWANHCDWCGAFFGDAYLIGRSDSPFNLLGKALQGVTEIHHYREPIAARSQYVLGITQEMISGNHW